MGAVGAGAVGAIGAERGMEAVRARDVVERAWDVEPAQRGRRRNSHIVITDAVDLFSFRQSAKPSGHVSECFVGLQKFSRDGIDKRDSNGHVGQNFFVEDDLVMSLSACEFIRDRGIRVITANDALSAAISEASRHAAAPRNAGASGAAIPRTRSSAHCRLTAVGRVARNTS